MCMSTHTQVHHFSTLYSSSAAEKDDKENTEWNKLKLNFSLMMKCLVANTL